MTLRPLLYALLLLLSWANARTVVVQTPAELLTALSGVCTGSFVGAQTETIQLQAGVTFAIEASTFFVLPLACALTLETAPPG
jgi:hypothetical protein